MITLDFYQACSLQSFCGKTRIPLLIWGYLEVELQDLIFSLYLARKISVSRENSSLDVIVFSVNDVLLATKYYRSYSLLFCSFWGKNLQVYPVSFSQSARLLCTLSPRCWNANLPWTGGTEMQIWIFNPHFFTSTNYCIYVIILLYISFLNISREIRFVTSLSCHSSVITGTFMYKY